MAKTRVYELAQKLGLDNKVVMDRLLQAGVDVKAHMSVLGEEGLRKYEAASAPATEKVEEERITPGLIRRRRKEVKPAVEAVSPEPAEPEAVKEPEPEVASASAEPVPVSYNFV